LNASLPMREHSVAINGKSMAAKTERRLGTLEARDGGNDRPVLLVVRYIVAPGHLDAEPLGIEAAPPYLNAVDRLPVKDGPTLPNVFAA
jgi:hypothetical protein